MRPVPPVPVMGDQGAEDGETLARWADDLLTWGEALAERVKAWQTRQREIEAKRNARP